MLFWITQSKSSPGKPDDLMSALTFHEILAATNLEHHARHFAIKGEPALKHDGLTVPEGDTLDLVERRIAARNSEFDADAKAIAQQLPLLTTSVDQDPAVVHHRVVDALTAVVAERAPSIREAVALERTRAAELAAFRDEQHIARPAEYPKSKLVHFRWLGVTVGVETIAESTLLIPATPDGLIGAGALALGVAIMTTILGLLIGFGAFRYMASPSVAKRVGSWLALPALAGALLLVALYVAHYRHVAGVSVDTPDDAQVIAHLLTQPFELTGPGWLLLFVSLACAAFAAWKGYTASDPIPGYEKVDRAYANARSDRDYVRADIQGALAAVKTSTVDSVLDQPALARLKREHLLNQYTGLEGKREQIEALAKQEAALALRALGHFRRVNLATRADGVTPDYFADLPGMSAEVAPIPAGLKERLEIMTAAAVADATTASEQALHMARMLAHTSDRADEIMAAVERARPREGDSPILDLRNKIEATLSATALPSPDAQPAIAGPTTSQS